MSPVDTRRCPSGFVLPHCSCFCPLALLTSSVALSYCTNYLPPLQHLLCFFPFPSYAVIAFGCASCPKITCGREGCGTEFCYHCKQLWHPNQTCDTARQQRAQNLRLRSFRSSSLSYSQESGAAGKLQTDTLTWVVLTLFTHKQNACTAHHLFLSSCLHR